MNTKFKFVIGANYGDEGKGLVSANYAAKAKRDGKSCLTVLFNGGPQRGHTVESYYGFRHVYHHLGAGSKYHADTYFHGDFMVNPMTFIEEYESAHVPPRVFVDYNCPVITPYDMMANQIKEMGRGDRRHGSCGMGIYETFNRMRSNDTRINSRYGSLATSKSSIGQFLVDVRRYYEEYGIRFDMFPGVDWDGLDCRYVSDFYRMIDSTRLVADMRRLYGRYDTVVYEGGQGLCLSMDNISSYPHLTPSRTGARHKVKELVDIYGSDIDVEISYVTRTYLTRHGNGPLDGEIAKYDIETDCTNHPNPWQGNIRYAYFTDDAMFNMIDRIMRDSDNLNVDRLRKNLVVTHNDSGTTELPKTPLDFSKGYFDSVSFIDRYVID